MSLHAEAGAGNGYDAFGLPECRSKVSNEDGLPLAAGAPGTGIAAEHTHSVLAVSSARTPSTESMPFFGVERIQGVALVAFGSARYTMPFTLPLISVPSLVEV